MRPSLLDILTLSPAVHSDIVQQHAGSCQRAERTEPGRVAPKCRRRCAALLERRAAAEISTPDASPGLGEGRVETSTPDASPALGGSLPCVEISTPNAGPKNQYPARQCGAAPPRNA
jgi:hypothetical protein